MLKKTIIAGLFGLLPAAAMAAGGAAPVYEFNVDRGNTASIQRGAQTYMNYCSGCHSLGFLRYNRIAKDLGIPEDLMQENLMFTTDKFGGQIHSAIQDESAGWFGSVPPDLSLVTRARSPKWVYNYLMTFYLDASKPTGVNNYMLPGASMPHVLGDLQGWQKMVPADESAADDGHGGSHGPSFEVIKEGSLNEAEYAKLSKDLTNFLVYAGEPGAKKRIGVGKWVIFYLIIFTIFGYLLKREYWKDVH